ncbi:MAG: restriction endonuclease [Paludibacter sp.]|nr:restriction endonuclease [Paludibacter sp.]
MKNSEAEKVLRKLLENDGYSLSPIRKNGELGVDILATKEKQKLYIECIGYKISNPARSKDFFEVFFRAISRLNDEAKECIIALPANYKLGFHQRVKQYSIGWKRIGDVFPELQIWFINKEEMKLEKFTWNKLLNFKN